ncbi:MAG TPA: carboxylesterase family protein [Opitutaceae bacterium]
MSRRFFIFLVAASLLSAIADAKPLKRVQVRIADGILEGVESADGKVRTFKGVPFAAPPIGLLRWKAPQPAASWDGVRPAFDYGPRPMQGYRFPDMEPNDIGPSEDCLYLNLWMPAEPRAAKLPVMVWIYGGGFAAGATSEPRQDGGNLSKKGVLVVSAAYREGAFGFLAHPELSRESGHGSGNYGLLDQVAALKWVQKNIAAFGGDPDNVTIFGESAGSFSVSALMASPLARGLFHKAIGESGAFLGWRLRAVPRAEAEQDGVNFARLVSGRETLEALRAVRASDILKESLKDWGGSFWPVDDGYFFPESASELYAKGHQAHVPLLAGWNRDELSFGGYFGKAPPGLESYVAIAREKFGSQADGFLRAYAASTDAQAVRCAQDYESDQVIAYGTWKWLEMHRVTGEAPVYRYEFDQTLPLPEDAPAGARPSAPHACEIAFVFRVLSSKHLPWRSEDRAVSELMATYWTNFAKTGDPNGPGLPRWPTYGEADGFRVLHLKAESEVTADSHRDRYLYLETRSQTPR